MDAHEGRVLVRVGEVLIDILVHEGPRVALHPGAHKGGKIQVRLAVELDLVVNHLVDGVGGGAVVRNTVGGEGLAGGVGGGVRGRVAVGAAARVGVAGGNLAEAVDDVVGVYLGVLGDVGCKDSPTYMS